MRGTLFPSIGLRTPHKHGLNVSEVFDNDDNKRLTSKIEKAPWFHVSVTRQVNIIDERALPEKRLKPGVLGNLSSFLQTSD